MQREPTVCDGGFDRRAVFPACKNCVLITATGMIGLDRIHQL
jgi:hypothetical protein